MTTRKRRASSSLSSTAAAPPLNGSSDGNHAGVRTRARADGNRKTPAGATTTTTPLRARSKSPASVRKQRNAVEGTPSPRTKTHDSTSSTAKRKRSASPSRSKSPVLTTTSSTMSRRSLASSSSSSSLTTVSSAYHNAKAEMELARDGIKLWLRPITTLRLFSSEIYEFSSYAMAEVLSHPLPRTFLPSATILYIALRVLGLTGTVDRVAAFVVWWVGLGVLSSIGLGTGMHSGMLFLFPHIFSVVRAAKACPSMDFTSYDDIWWQSSEMSCTVNSSSSSIPPSFARIFLRVWVPAFLWGAGTAMGEIPPYAMSRAAKLAGGEMEDEIQEELRIDATDAMGRMKKMMIDFVERYGFWGVFLMSAWPNAAFDLVGIVCGQIGVSFATFFLATFCGKALVKVTGQVIFFVALFLHTADMAHFAAVAYSYVPFIPKKNKLEIEHSIEKFIAGMEKRRHGGAEREEGVEAASGLVKKGFEYLVLTVVVVFAVSCINQIAQKRQKDLDEAALKRKFPGGGATTSSSTTRKTKRADV